MSATAARKALARKALASRCSSSSPAIFQRTPARSRSSFATSAATVCRTGSACRPASRFASTVTVRAPSVRCRLPTVGAATRVTKFEIGTDPFTVSTRRSSSAAKVRRSGGRRRRMSTASSAPAGRKSASFTPLVTSWTMAPISAVETPCWAASALSTFSSQSTPGGGRPSPMSITPGTLRRSSATRAAAGARPAGSAAESSTWIALPLCGPAFGTCTSTSAPGMPAVAARSSSRMVFAPSRSRQSTNSNWMTPITSSALSLSATRPTRV